MKFFVKGYNPEDSKLLLEIAEKAYERSLDKNNPDSGLSHAIAMAADARKANLDGLVSDEDLKKIDRCVKYFLKERGY